MPKKCVPVKYNSQHKSSSALLTSATIWQSTIGRDPYALAIDADEERKGGKTIEAATGKAKQDQRSTKESSYGGFSPQSYRELKGGKRRLSLENDRYEQKQLRAGDRGSSSEDDTVEAIVVAEQEEEERIVGEKKSKSRKANKRKDNAKSHSKKDSHHRKRKRSRKYSSSSSSTSDDDDDSDSETESSSSYDDYRRRERDRRRRRRRKFDEKKKKLKRKKRRRRSRSSDDDDSQSTDDSSSDESSESSDSADKSRSKKKCSSRRRRNELKHERNSHDDTGDGEQLGDASQIVKQEKITAKKAAAPSASNGHQPSHIHSSHFTGSNQVELGSTSASSAEGSASAEPTQENQCQQHSLLQNKASKMVSCYVCMVMDRGADGTERKKNYRKTVLGCFTCGKGFHVECFHLYHLQGGGASCSVAIQEKYMELKRRERINSSHPNIEEHLTDPRSWAPILPCDG